MPQIQNDIVIKLQDCNYNISNLNNEEKKELDIFIGYLSTIYDNMADEKLGDMNLVDRCKYLTDYFKPTSRYSLADRVVRSFGYFAEIDTLDQIFKMINDIKNKSQNENSEFGKYLEKNIFELNDNDLLRCVGLFNILGSSFENGNVCNEQHP